VIGREHQGAARPAGHERGLDHLPEIGLGRHVRDGIVHEHAVELATQPYRPHVALDVLALRVEGPAHGQHARHAVDERHREVRPQVRRVVAAAAAELEQRPRRRLAGIVQLTAVERGLFGVLGRRREERPPGGQLVVELHRTGLKISNTLAGFPSSVILSRNTSPNRRATASDVAFSGWIKLMRRWRLVSSNAQRIDA
jgi:hypothetical protein